jgi:type I restriction enzyme M protein
MTGTGGLQRVPRSFVEEFEIPLPPIDIQGEIVAEIMGYQGVVDGAQAVVNYYRPNIPVNPDWPIEAFGSVTTAITPPAKIQANSFRSEGRFPVIDQSQNAIAGRTDDEAALVDGSEGLVIFGDHTCAVKYVSEPFAQGADGIKIIKAGEHLLPKYVYYYLLSNPISQDGYKRHYGKLKEMAIAVPPLEVQRLLVSEIEAEDALVDGNRELVSRFQNKIEAAVARIWGDREAVVAGALAHG